MEGESVDFGLLNSQGGGRCQVNVSLIYWEKKMTEWLKTRGSRGGGLVLKKMRNSVWYMYRRQLSEA